MLNAPTQTQSPAEIAATESLSRVYECIDNGRSFRLEAGAGAGKTYSLVKALAHVIAKQGNALLKRHQQVACITYTNVATDEIAARIDSHPAVFVSTIHSFCWSLIKDFQPSLRELLPSMSAWTEKLATVESIGDLIIAYDEFGHRAIREKRLSLHHDDVIYLTVMLMAKEKFCSLIARRYPLLFIDEYQDTNSDFAGAMKTYLLGVPSGPVIGLFGDHWQKIYGTGCGSLEHEALEPISKEANFRSSPVIVNALNYMRPALPQHVSDPQAPGNISVYHTNNWAGTRRPAGPGGHWTGDLPAEVVQRFLESLQEKLRLEGWSFEHPGETKVLMLTHNALADRQGYRDLANVFPYNDSFIKKQDPFISFFVDFLEPLKAAYEGKRFGEMFDILGGRGERINSLDDKTKWATDMAGLISACNTGSIGDVIAYLKTNSFIRLSEGAESRLVVLEQTPVEGTEELPFVTQARKLLLVPYGQIVALKAFLDGHSPFETKHGVKGAEFDNVLVVFGRGWSQYNFGQFLEWSASTGRIPTDKVEVFERNRNLFYVVCSRPKKRLALLFTQLLSEKALSTLEDWFGKDVILDFSAGA